MTPAQPRAAVQAAVSSSLREVTTRRAHDTQSTKYSLPFVLVLGYLLVDFGRPHNWLPPLGLLRPGMIVLSGSMLMLLNRRVFPSTALARYVLAFLGVMVALVPFAYNSRMAFNTTRDFALLVFGAVLPMMAFVDTHDRLYTLARFWLWVHIPLALYGITHRGIGIGSFLGDENDFCLALNMMLPFGFALAGVARGPARKLVLLGGVGVLLAAITSTRSRGGFIGLVCVGAMIWLRSPRKLRTLALVAVFTGLLAALTPDSYWKEMQTIRTANEPGDTGYGRLYAWGIAWRMFLERPLGVGPANFQYNTWKYEEASEQQRGVHLWGHVSHSLYFTLLPEEGIIGVIVFFGMVWRGWRERRKLRRDCQAMLKRPELPAEAKWRLMTLVQLTAALDASLVTFLVTGAFITVLYYPQVWLLTALTEVTIQVGKRELAAAGLRAEPVSARPTLRHAPWQPR